MEISFGMVCNAIALYEKRGIIAAVQYLMDKGCKVEEAIEILNCYDLAVASALTKDMSKLN